MAVCWRGRQPGSRPLTASLLIFSLAVLGSVAALGVGRVWPPRAIVVTHATTLLQLPGGGALMSMRGSAEFPAYAGYQLSALVADAAVEPRPQPTAEQWFDDRGFPFLSGVFGLHAVREFSLDGVLGLSWVKVERQGTRVRATNESAVELRDCRFPDGYSPGSVRTLRPGQAVEAVAAEPDEGDSPFFSCTPPESPVQFADASHQVDVRGSWLVSAGIPSADSEAAGLRRP